MPLARMDCASSASRSLWKARRGCSGLGSMEATGMFCAASAWAGASGRGAGAGVRVGRSALMPLPSALREVSGLFMFEDLFGELDIAFGAAGTGIVGQDRFAETGRLRQADASGNDGFENLFVEEFLQIGGNLPGQVGPVVEHGQQNPGDLQRVL